MRFQLMAPMSAPKINRLSTNAGSMMPLPTVLATLRWNTAKASTLKNAAQNTACQGLSTPVETTVAIEFAASWKPFMKSNASASSTSSTSVVEKWLKSIWKRPTPSGVFEHDAFDDVGHVLALVGRGLERLVHGLQLDDLAHVAFMAKQLRDRTAHHLVGVGLEPVDFLADLEDGGRVGHRGHEAHRRLHTLRAAQQQLGELYRFGRDLLDVVQHQRFARVLDQVE